MKEAEAATRIEALVEGYAELAEKATEACKTALDRLEVAQADNMALNALLAIADAKLQQAERALEEIEAWKLPETEQFWINTDGSMSDRPMPYEVAWGSNGARDYIRQVARQALSSIRQTGSV